MLEHSYPEQFSLVKEKQKTLFIVLVGPSRILILIKLLKGGWACQTVTQVNFNIHLRQTNRFPHHRGLMNYQTSTGSGSDRRPIVHAFRNESTPNF